MTAVQWYYLSLLAATAIVYPLEWLFGPSLINVLLLVGIQYVSMRIWYNRHPQRR